MKTKKTNKTKTFYELTEFMLKRPHSKYNLYMACILQRINRNQIELFSLGNHAHAVLFYEPWS